MAVTEELVAFLKDCLDEDERVAQLVHGRTGQQIVVDLPEYVDEETSIHRKVVVFDPVRVLAEVAAKRRIIDRCEQYARWAANDDAPGFQALEAAGEHMLRLLAPVYAGRPGWREEWAADEEENRDC